MESMSSSAKKAQRLLRRERDSSAKHFRTSSGNVQYTNERNRGDGSDATDDVDDLDIDQEFGAIRVGDLLESDPRPTFVVDLEANSAEGVQPVFFNQSFRSDSLLSTTFLANVGPGPQQASLKVSRSGFLSWITIIGKLDEPDTPHPSSFLYNGFLWTGFTIRRRWGIVSVSPISGDINASTALHRRGDSPNNVLSEKKNPQPIVRISSPEESSILTVPTSMKPPASLTSTAITDWTVREPKGDLSPHLILARSVDWSLTPLGDMSTWSPEFRQVANLLMANPHPAALFVRIIGSLSFHPRLELRVCTF